MSLAGARIIVDHEEAHAHQHRGRNHVAPLGDSLTRRNEAAFANRQTHNELRALALTDALRLHTAGMKLDQVP